MSTKEKCEPCYGRGRRLLDRTRDNIKGMMVNGPVICPDCNGTGERKDG